MADPTSAAPQLAQSDVEHVTALPTLTERPADSHKGSFGRVLVVGGSRGMSGAAALAGMAALRGGAGLVTVACPEEIAAIVASFEPSYLTLPLPGDREGRFAEDAIAKVKDLQADVVAIGPGLGRSNTIAKLVAHLLSYEKVPLVIDADAISHLGGSKDILKHRKHATILTPHPGEFGILTGLSIEVVQSAREAHAVWFAREYGVVMLLKGYRTVISDGRRVAVNATGNAGMATGGSGDVLTGLLAALLAQGLGPFEATQLAAHLHGLAGDIAAERVGHVSLIASDIIGTLPDAFRRHASGRFAKLENDVG